MNIRANILLPLFLAVGTAASFLVISCDSKGNYRDEAEEVRHEIEKSFFKVLRRSDSHDRLAKELGVVPNPTTHSRLRSKRLTWRGAFEEGGRERWVLIFSPMTASWPGSQPITIVLTDSKFRPLSWRTVGGEPMFNGAALTSEYGSHKLNVTFRTRRGAGDMILPFLITNDELLSFDASPVVSADKSSATTPSPTRHFLAEAAKNGTSSEKPFFAALLKARGQDRLLDELGLIQPVHWQQWRIGRPDGSSHLVTDADLQGGLADHFRKELRWSGTLGEGERQRRVLIFAPMMQSWPGSQPITIVLTDLNYQPLSWCIAGGEPMFQKAEVAPEKGDLKLSVTFDTRRGPDLVLPFLLTNDAILSFEASPAVTALEDVARAQGPTRNLLADAIQNARPTEKPLFEALNKAGGYDLLLDELGLVQPASWQRWRIKLPDGGSHHVTEADFETGLGVHLRKDICWSGTFGEGSHQRRILIFRPMMVVSPTPQHVTIILTDTNYRPLSWRNAGGESMFSNAELVPDNGNQKLNVAFQPGRFGYGEIVAHFLVTEEAILHYDDPKIDLPHQEVVK